MKTHHLEHSTVFVKLNSYIWFYIQLMNNDLIVLNEVFNLTKILSKYLQYVDVSVCAVQCKGNAMQESLKELRTDSEFQWFWKEAEEISVKLDIDEPLLLRQRRIPSKFGGGEMCDICLLLDLIPSCMCACTYNNVFTLCFNWDMNHVSDHAILRK